MSNRLEWIFELEDRMSGPARRVERSLGRVDRALHSTDRAAEATGSGFTRTGQAMISAGLAVGRFVARAAAVAATTAAVAGLAAAAYSANEAIDAMTSRDRNLRALEILGGSAEEALRMRGRFRDLSEHLGIDPRETANGIQNLLTKGFSEAESVDIFQGVSDIAAISPDADVSRIILAMSQIKQAGVLQGDELRQLTESGLPLEHVYERIGQAMGVAASEVKNLRGTVPAAVAINAIMQGIQDTTGKGLGQVAREASLSLGGMLERLKQAPTRLFDAMADKTSAVGQRLTGLVARLTEFLNPSSATGQRIIDGLVTALDFAVSALEKIPAVMATITGWWNTAKGWLDAIPRGALDDFVLGLKSISAVAAVVVLGIGGIVAAAIALQGAIVSKIGSMVRPFVDLYTWIKSVIDRLAMLFGMFQATGGSSMDGFMAGWLAKAQMALQMVRQFGDSAAQALRSALGIHSPSRVFMEAGAMSGEGFALGLAGSMPDASYDYGGAAPAPARSAGSSVTNNITVEVHAAPGENGEQLADAIAKTIRREVAALFEGLALEQGMA